MPRARGFWICVGVAGFGALFVLLPPLSISLLTMLSDAEILHVAGGTFAACFVWLIVRIVNRRERWAIAVAVATAVMAAIVMTAGDAILQHLVTNGWITWE